MKNNQKIMVVLLSAAMMASMVSCGDSNPTIAASTTATEAAATPAETSAAPETTAAAAILSSLPAIYIQLFAFLGGIAAVGLTISIPKLIRSDSNLMLVLSGIIVGGAMGSVFGLIKYLADPATELAEITYWQMGSLANISYDSLLGILFPVLISMVLLLLMSWWMEPIQAPSDMEILCKIDAHKKADGSFEVAQVPFRASSVVENLCSNAMYVTKLGLDEHGKGEHIAVELLQGEEYFTE